MIKPNYKKNSVHGVTVKKEEKWQYALSKYNKNNTTGYFYCAVTNCMGRGSNKFIIDDKDNLSNNILKEKFEIVKAHTL